MGVYEQSFQYCTRFVANAIVWKARFSLLVSTVRSCFALLLASSFFCWSACRVCRLFLSSCLRCFSSFHLSHWFTTAPVSAVLGKSALCDVVFLWRRFRRRLRLSS